MARRILRTFLRDFGPVKPITEARAIELCNTHRAPHVLSIIEGDSGTAYGAPGFHYVNRTGEYYETAKPITIDVEEVFNIWWSDEEPYTESLPRWEPTP